MRTRMTLTALMKMKGIIAAAIVTETETEGGPTRAADHEAGLRMMTMAGLQNVVAAVEVVVVAVVEEEAVPVAVGVLP